MPSKGRKAELVQRVADTSSVRPPAALTPPAPPSAVSASSRGERHTCEGGETQDKEDPLSRGRTRSGVDVDSCPRDEGVSHHSKRYASWTKCELCRARRSYESKQERVAQDGSDRARRRDD